MRLGLAAWCGGILLVQMFPWLPGPSFRWALMGLALLCWQCTRLRPLTWCLLGCCWAIWRADSALAERVPARLVGATQLISGRITALPEPNLHSVRFLLEATNSPRHLPWPDGHQQVRLTAFAPSFAIEAGMHCTFYARLRQPRGLRSPGAFDLERWSFGNGIDAVGYVVAHPANRCTLDRAYSIARIRHHIAHAIATRVPDPAQASILAALAVGARASIADEQWKVLRNTGVVHLISVSGLHVAMISVGAFIIVRWLNAAFSLLLRRDPDPRITAVCAFGIAAVYALVAGFTVPTQRTLLMIAIALWNKLQAQPLFSLESLLLAAAVLLFATPAASLTLSFWLSFGAVGLLMVLDLMRSSAGWRQRWVDVHFVVALLFAPMLAFSFQSVSLASPLANIVAIPGVTLLIVPLTLTGAAFAAVAQTLSAYCWTVAARLWQWIWAWLALLDSWLPPLVVPYQPTPNLALISLLGAVLLLTPFRAPRILLLPAVVALFFLSPEPALRVGEFEVVMLDVGQGLSVVVVTARHVLVYDTGPRFAGGSDLGATVVVPYLRGRGIRRVDRLVVSHGDSDHAGGAQAVAQAFPVTELLSSDPHTLATVSAERAVRCQAGQRWAWDGVTFEMIYPLAMAAGSDNDQSCVLQITGPDGSALLSGDISVAAERVLVRDRAKLGAELLVVPHHGSKSSSSGQFIDAVAPRYALFSAGHRNRFNHPAPSVLSRYRRRGITCLESALEGTVSVRFTQAATTLSTARRARRRYWDLD